ncbi:cob(I)yrinic acid a,c-diamide adenosyltransferase [Clostridium formicaceticum]|uniref:Corrinoid adenosyltransferase n=1 Tax=Clostridium formicaceticum TaxID=1497 RepID=A0AAC9WGJ0_9CLOT|nr:cob(I)yrinic acid a,c-diamide adenosyltransferase [Clostridium formicaceticum]AOY77446.1 ATP:cob(I)alamin adenosyltransferase [Clostridium formicaceticum]ARE88003.1 Cob(I)yrinic acid a,c-diamide adenosyltransferase [Clostridium formicaceticum]
MKIYTKTGDYGETSLYDGKRVRKDDIRVESYGTIDELNASLGFARNYIEDEKIIEIIYRIQAELFDVAGELATVNKDKFSQKIREEHINFLEKTIDEYLEKIDEINAFIIPGTGKASASLHVARTVCRRAERRVLTLSTEADVSPILIKYINRLSDLIYAIARYLEKELKYVVFKK